MNHSLPSVKDLLVKSIEQYRTYWRQNLTLVSVMLIPYLALQIMTFIDQHVSDVNPAGLILLGLSFPVIIANLCVGLWFFIKLPQTVLEQLGLKTRQEHWISLAMSVVWVDILQGITTILAFFCFIFPAIWLTVPFAFLPFLIIKDGLLGSKAIGASIDLVKGRWWATFGRLLGTYVVFGLAVGLILAAIIGISLQIAYPGHVLEMLHTHPSNETPSTVEFVSGLIVSILSFLTLPLFTIIKARLFDALQNASTTNP